MSEGIAPKDWNRPIIDKFISLNYVEHPRDEATRIVITEPMIKNICGGTCRVIIGILCKQTDPGSDVCVYDIYTRWQSEIQYEEEQLVNSPPVPIGDDVPATPRLPSN
jgi:hypothetical protein